MNTSSLPGISSEEMGVLLSEVLVKSEDELGARFTEAGKEDIFEETRALCWDLLKDILVTGQGFLRTEDDFLCHLESSLVEIGGGGTLESTIYKHHSPGTGLQEFPWDQVYHCMMETAPDGEYRLMVWLPSGTVFVEDFSKLTTLLWYALERCVFEVVLSDD